DRTGTNWIPRGNPSLLYATAGGHLAGFGSSVALHGGMLAVGAKNESGGDTGLNGVEGSGQAYHSGAVFLFDIASAPATQLAYIKAPNAEILDYFGSEVALDGTTLAV